MSLNISYGIAKLSEDLEQILNLQKENLPSQISIEEASNEGFVTLRHDLELLKSMNSPYPHVIAKYDEQLVGYALVMLRRFSKELPILFPMFEKLEKLWYNNKKLKDQSYFVMGQVCIKKGFRGKGILKDMYSELKHRMKNDFDFMVTEISTKNQRSIKAHSKLGFEEIHSFQSNNGEHWSIILLNLND